MTSDRAISYIFYKQVYTYLKTKRLRALISLYLRTNLSQETLKLNKLHFTTYSNKNNPKGRQRHFAAINSTYASS